MPPQEKLADVTEAHLSDVEDSSPCSECNNCSHISHPQDGHSTCLQCRNAYLNPAFVPDIGGGSAKGGEHKDTEHADTARQEKELQHNQLMDFDELLPHIGEFGLYQKLLFLLMIPFAFFVAWVYFSQIFMSLTPEDHWCTVPELVHANFTPEQMKMLSIPKAVNSSEYDKCRMYSVNYTQMLLDKISVADSSWPTVPCRHGWQYNLSDIRYHSIVTELDWVCEQSALPNAAQSIFFAGAILGGLVFGWVADRYGRVPALVGANMVGFGAGICSAFVHSFWTFSLCRFFVGMAFDNCFTMMYILVLEYVGPKWRTFVANMSIALFFTLAACVLPWLAYYIADWRMFCIVTSAPLALAILTPWLVPESARWLVSSGKIEQAICILKSFEKVNKTKVDDKLYQKFREDCMTARKAEEAGKTYSVLDLFSSKRLRNITILLIIIWMAISLVFDGHVRSVSALGLDIFLTFTVASATELPADTFLTLVLDRWGRRWLACGSMVVSGIFSLLATTVPIGIASASLAIAGRFSVNISYNIGLQYAAEVLPTVVRAQGVALIHIMGYVSSILAPFIIYLAEYNQMLPLLILGVLGILGGILCLYLPETLDQELPQTLEDGENFGRNQRLMDMPCIKRRQEEPEPTPFKRSTVTTSSVHSRVSIRGEGYRSSIISRQRKSATGTA